MAYSASDLEEMIAAKKKVAAWLFEGERDESLAAERIDALEKSRGVVLPQAYREFLQRHGAGDFAFGHVYSPLEESEWSLWKEFAFMPEKRGQIIPFSDNGCGDYYCFPVVDGRCGKKIVWADHEQRYEVIDAEYGDF
ncbi:MAG: SMI1/KNR4 family protein, partial [Opitutaceae bacterium]|nr:SMI1/KNR4 family protein [Opitutaceae bacterium]